MLVAVFLTGIISIAFLTVGASPNSDPDKPSVIDYALSLAAFAAGVYFFIKAPEIVDRISLLSPLSGWDLFFGILTVVLTVEITRRTTGAGLTLVVLIFIAYNFFGHLLGGVLKHGYIDTVHFIDIMVYTTDGIMGLPARVAATYAFMFVLFGVVLYAANQGYVDDVPLKKVVDFERALISYARSEKSDLLTKINADPIYNDDVQAALKELVESFKSNHAY